MFAAEKAYWKKFCSSKKPIKNWFQESTGAENSNGRWKSARFAWREKFQHESLLQARKPPNKKDFNKKLISGVFWFGERAFSMHRVFVHRKMNYRAYPNGKSLENKVKKFTTPFFLRKTSRIHNLGRRGRKAQDWEKVQRGKAYLILINLNFYRFFFETTKLCMKMFTIPSFFLVHPIQVTSNDFFPVKNFFTALHNKLLCKYKFMSKLGGIKFPIQIQFNKFMKSSVANKRKSFYNSNCLLHTRVFFATGSSFDLQIVSTADGCKKLSSCHFNFVKILFKKHANWY